MGEGITVVEGKGARPNSPFKHILCNSKIDGNGQVLPLFTITQTLTRLTNAAFFSNIQVFFPAALTIVVSLPALHQNFILS